MRGIRDRGARRRSFTGISPSWGAGAVEQVVFIKATTRGPLGVPFRPKAEARNHLLQVMDLFTGRVEMALWCEEQVSARIGSGTKPWRAALL